VGLDVEDHLRVDPTLVRVAEGTPSVGDPTRAREALDWHPQVNFEGLVARMVEADLRDLRESASLS
jgi:GDPmannose 4,6-dehydratase